MWEKFKKNTKAIGLCFSQAKKRKTLLLINANNRTNVLFKLFQLNKN